MFDIGFERLEHRSERPERPLGIEKHGRRLGGILLGEPFLAHPLEVIARRLEEEVTLDAEGLELSEKAEIHLARMLARFAETVPVVLDDFRPNLLANYLLELARAYHSFFQSCPVLKSEGAVRKSRLVLCELTARVLEKGLGLLGVAVPERM